MARTRDVACLVPEQPQSLLVSRTRTQEAAKRSEWGWRVVCQVRKWCRAMEGHRREVLRREAAALRPKHCLMKLVAAAEWMEGAEVWQQG